MMLKTCDLAIIKPLLIIFRSCISHSICPDPWKKSNICPIHKKVDKQINNYRPVSLLLIYGKVFERLIFNSLYEYLGERKLFSTDQFGFGANDSCVNQLPIVDNRYTAFDACPTLQSRDVFLDMSKVFDNVWREGFIFKLKSMVVPDALLELIKSF